MSALHIFAIAAISLNVMIGFNGAIRAKKRETRSAWVCSFLGWISLLILMITQP